VSDTAKGPLVGYLFQFEKALLLLSDLTNNDDYVSIEEVDDIAIHKEDSTVLMTIQAKHSIASSGTTFEDTSYALWRTIQIWLEKLEKGIFNENTTFICATNKSIPGSSLLYKIKNSSFDDLIIDIQALIDEQKIKSKELKRDRNKGQYVEKIIGLIEYAIIHKSNFKIIDKNIKIEDDEKIKAKFLERLFLDPANYSETQQDSIFQEFYGWITTTCASYWKNGKEARITKHGFNQKHNQIFSNPSIVNAVFRTKESLGSIGEIAIKSKRKELFVKQIEDINRRKESKERIIREAILDYIYSDIELTYIISRGDYTEVDFQEFLEHCVKTWQTCFDETVIKEIEEYTEDEKNNLAIKIYDSIMNHIDIKFKSSFSFNPSDKYVKNGSFLKLSNLPKIGWHPEWETKYKNTDGSKQSF
jgi:hypothetical protein